MFFVGPSAGRAGFTLLELIIALFMIGILLALAAPNYSQWLEAGRYRKTARGFVSALREARARAVSENLEHRVEFDLDAGAFRMTHGNRPMNSTDSSWDNNVIFGWIELPGQTIWANESCDVGEGTVNIHLNPDGSGGSRYICLFDQQEKPYFRIGIPHAATGQVVTTRWNTTHEAWE